MKFPIQKRFKLTESFIDKYKEVEPNFGYSGLGKFVFMRTYSRIKEDGTNEQWWETVRRVVEGIYSIQWQHIDDYNLGWHGNKAQRSAQEMYDRIFSFKMLGSGRSLWAMGTPVIMEKGLAEALFNCSFRSTSRESGEFYDILANLMDFLMLGVGVGTDLDFAKSDVIIREQNEKVHEYIIPDTREGWVDSLRVLAHSFFGGKKYTFDYSEIRPYGSPIKTFGGIASGAEPLEELHVRTQEILSSKVGQSLSEKDVADIINLIGVCVVSGNVRRSAEMVLSDESEEFLSLKDYEINPDRAGHGWASNNSIRGTVGMDYAPLVEKITSNGEPAVVWLDNFRDYGRMRSSERSGVDSRISGVNPCSEIGLESSELCNLCEIIPSNHEDLADFLKTIKYAYLFAKSVTLLSGSWPETNRVMLRNRRIGLGLTGITQFAQERGLPEMKKWMDSGYDLAKKYDKIYSDWFAIPQSIKITTIKPSGTLSLLAGVTAGVHFPQSNFYIRRVRVSRSSPMVKVLKSAGYKVVPAKEDPKKTYVVEFPVALRTKMKTISDVSIWEQVKIAEFCQRNWADNGVSVTVTFSEEEGKDILPVLEYAQFSMKAISFLPNTDGGAYEQMPYETITEKRYVSMSKNLRPLDFSNMSGSESVGEKYCETDVCEIKTEEENIIKEFKLGE